MARKPAPGLRVALPQAASPRAVSRLAYHLDRWLRLARPDLEEGDVTIEVRNFTTKVAVRPQTQRGRTAVRTTRSLISKPQQTPVERADLLHEILAAAKEFDAIQVAGPKGRHLATLDGTFCKRAENRLQRIEAPSSVGETILFSHVLRVGRGGERAGERALIKVGAEYHDVPFDEGLRHVLYEAAENKQSARLRVRGTWVREAEPALRLDATTARILDASLQTSASGEDVLQALDEAFPDGIDDVDAFMARARG